MKDNPLIEITTGLSVANELFFNSRPGHGANGIQYGLD
jgi:hypothetical protein